MIGTIIIEGCGYLMALLFVTAGTMWLADAVKKGVAMEARRHAFSNFALNWLAAIVLAALTRWLSGAAA